MSTKPTTAQEGTAAIAALVEQAYALINQAEAIADEFELGFSFGVAYGMGGYYSGDPEERSEDSEDGWSASSQGC